MYKVLLVDDEALIREAISENIRWEEMGFSFLGSCENGKEAMERIRQTPPDLLLTDINMPYVDGLELARYVRENYPDTRTVIISGYDEFEYAKQAVRYQVMEYILKPVTPSELNEMLARAKASLDERSMRSRTLKKLRGAYVSNCPFLRGRFLNSLLRGNERPENLEEKMEELEISLCGDLYNTAIVEGDDLSPFLNQYADVRDELALFSIYNITQELIEQRGLGSVFQDMDGRTVIIFCGSGGEESLRQETETALEEVRRTIFRLLSIESTAGVGEWVTNIQRLYQSFEKAKEAMELKFFQGGNQILHAAAVGESKGPFSIEVPLWASRAVLAIKTGNEAEIEQNVKAFAQEIRDSHINRNRSILYVQNLLLTVIGMTNLTEEKENQIVEEERNLMNRIDSYEHLTDMAQEVIDIFSSISGLLSEQRDSYGKKQALLAMEYIEQNYSNSDVNLNSVCSYLAMSTSYFSTLFKGHTGETFIEALTKKRMEKAKELLEHTSMKAYEVAAEVGYGDPHYFSIAFKKFAGKTPTEYAREKRNP